MPLRLFHKQIQSPHKSLGLFKWGEHGKSKDVHSAPTWQADDGVEGPAFGHPRGGHLTALPQALVVVDRGHYVPLPVLLAPVIHARGGDDRGYADKAEDEPGRLQHGRSHVYRIFGGVGCAFSVRRLRGPELRVIKLRRN